MRGGSTLGNILLSHISFLSVDIGLPQLAMHSSFETAGTYDIDYAIKAFKEFYQSSIIIDGNKFIIK
jgi:aspartyl aminopeptidase